jgi:hypothetical protein
MTSLSAAVQALADPSAFDYDAMSLTSATSFQDSNKVSSVPLRIEFTIPRNDKKPFPGPQAHKNVLVAMTATFPTEISFLDNHGDPIDLQAWPNDEASYKARFSSITITAKRSKSFVVSHDLVSSVTLSVLKRTDIVSAFLKSNQCFIRTNPWDHTTLDTVSLGWLLEIHPQRFYRQDVALYLRRALTRVESTVLIQLHQSNPMTELPDGTKTRTRAIEIQVRRQDVNAAYTAFKQIFDSGALAVWLGSFVPYKLRHENQPLYLKSVQAQNTYLQQTRNITIVGVSKHNMLFPLPDKECMRTLIFKSKHFRSIQRTSHTAIEGRWNLITSEKSFRAAKQWITENLTLIFHFIPPEERNSFPDIPSPQLSLRPSSLPSSSAISFSSTVEKSMESILPQSDHAQPPDSIMVPVPDISYKSIEHPTSSSSITSATLPTCSTTTDSNAEIATLRQALQDRDSAMALQQTQLADQAKQLLTLQAQMEKLIVDVAGSNCNSPTTSLDQPREEGPLLLTQQSLEDFPHLLTTISAPSPLDEVSAMEEEDEANRKKRERSPAVPSPDTLRKLNEPLPWQKPKKPYRQQTLFPKPFAGRGGSPGSTPSGRGGRGRGK